MSKEIDEVLEQFENDIEIWNMIFSCAFGWTNAQTRQWAEEWKAYAIREPGSYLHESTAYYAAYEFMTPTVVATLTPKQQRHLHADIAFEIQNSFTHRDDGRLVRVDGKLHLDCQAMLFRIDKLVRNYGEGGE